MVFWFIGTAIVTVGFVFRDPNFDNRLLIIGAILPSVDVVFGGARAFHSITVSIALLAGVMLFTSRGSDLRRMLLGLPIGMFLHLVFDAAWNDTDTFWWPFTGLSFSDDGIPIADRGLLSVALEVIGIGICAWLWRVNELGDGSRRRRFLEDGRLTSVPDRFR